MSMKQTRKNRLVATHNLKKDKVQVCASLLMEQNQRKFAQVLEIIEEESELLHRWCVAFGLVDLARLMDLEGYELYSILDAEWPQSDDEKFSALVADLGDALIQEKLTAYKKLRYIDFSQ